MITRDTLISIEAIPALLRLLRAEPVEDLDVACANAIELLQAENATLRAAARAATDEAAQRRRKLELLESMVAVIQKQAEDVIRELKCMQAAPPAAATPAREGE